MSDGNRFSRNELFFGKEGQEKLRAARCAIVGVGGLGTHVVQQLALLGVGAMDLIEPEDLSTDNRNRYIGAWHTDPIPGSPKVQLGKRLVNLIDPTIAVETVDATFVSADGYAAIRRADYIFGCLDNDGGRLILTEVCSAYARTYIDLASDIDADEMRYGGRIHFAKDGESCLICIGEIDQGEVASALESSAFRRDRDAIYGIQRDALAEVGPSVVSINGVVASLAVTEFMVHLTGIRAPQRLLTYYAHTGKVTTSTAAQRAGCYYCKGLWNKGTAANLDRHIRISE